MVFLCHCISGKKTHTTENPLVFVEYSMFIFYSVLPRKKIHWCFVLFLFGSPGESESRYSSVRLRGRQRYTLLLSKMWLRWQLWERNRKEQLPKSYLIPQNKSLQNIIGCLVKVSGQNQNTDQHIPKH